MLSCEMVRGPGWKLELVQLPPRLQVLEAAKLVVLKLDPVLHLVLLRPSPQHVDLATHIMLPPTLVNNVYKHVQGFVSPDVRLIPAKYGSWARSTTSPIDGKDFRHDTIAWYSS